MGFRDYYVKVEVSPASEQTGEFEEGHKQMCYLGAFVEVVVMMRHNMSGHKTVFSISYHKYCFSDIYIYILRSVFVVLSVFFFLNRFAWETVMVFE